MFGLSYLFYPWAPSCRAWRSCTSRGRRPENYWFYIIFFGGFLGASVLYVAEVLPDLRLLRGVFQGFGRRSRIQKVETDILDNPSVAITKNWAKLYKDQGNTRRRATVSIMRSPGEAIRSTPFYSAGAIVAGIG